MAWLFTQLKPNKQNFSFLLTSASILGFFILAFVKGTDVATVIPTILGLFYGSKTTEKVAFAVSASRDPACNTAEVIKGLEENK